MLKAFDKTAADFLVKLVQHYPGLLDGETEVVASELVEDITYLISKMPMHHKALLDAESWR